MECPLTMEKHIYFVRHGESNSNVDGLHRGPHATLTERGHEQAAALAERIERIGVDALVSSSYLRTLETAEHISTRLGLPVEQSELFVERRRPSIALNRAISDPEAKTVMQKIFEGYADENHRHSDEENFEDLRERGNAALDFLIAHPAQRICVVTHGLFLRLLFCAALNGTNFSGRDYQRTFVGLETSNTGVSHFVYKTDPFSLSGAQKWIVVNWNDSSHLG
jgi:broad specificity phosphatase PhoE